MSFLVKTIKGRKYVYRAYRTGKTVKHDYLGPLKSVIAQNALRRSETWRKVPDRLKPYFWDTNPERLNLKSHSKYVMERVLEIGTMDAVQWLQGVYPTGQIIDVVDGSRRLSEKSKNFWRIWFGGPS